MAINNGEHTIRKHVLLQRYGDTCEMDTSWWDRGDSREKEITSVICIRTGQAYVQIHISPIEARAISASLLKHADEVEAARHQLELEAEPA